MKTLIVIMLSVFFVSCNGQNNQKNRESKIKDGALQIDTISILPLINKQYGNHLYKVLRVCNLDSEEGYQVKSSGRIELTQESKIVNSISLPTPDDDVKNFSVTKIVETKKGFKVAINWGGGNNIYDVGFYFSFKNDQFYIDEIITEKYGPNTKLRRKKMKINPPISIDKFKIIDYLE